MQIVVTETPDPAARQAVIRLMDEYNDVAGGITKGRHLGIFLRDEQGAINGGLIGISYWKWLYVDLLVVPEAMRGTGIGRALMRTAEAVAQGWGEIGIWLGTMDFQAPDFYPRLGYAKFAELPHAGGHVASFFTRRGPFPAATPDPRLEIVEEPTKPDREAVANVLRAYNDGAGTQRPDRRGFAALLRDPDTGEWAGGLLARADRGWLFVELLVLPEHARRQRLGTRLMDLVEQEARDRGYLGVWLDTFSFQARPFYERRGYRVFGRIDDYPPGQCRYLLAKRVDSPDTDGLA